MKRFLLVLFVCLGFLSHGQTYNNEWIDYSKTYYKFNVGSDGLYRINQASLNSIGLGSTPVQDIQIWRNGQEITLFTSIAAGPLGPSDYIEFWGKMNDGKPDKELYRVADYQLSDKWSLQTDTAAFFLTVNPGGGNLRFDSRPNNVAGNSLPPEPYFMYTYSNHFKNALNPGIGVSVGELLYSSSYDKGEGWTSPNLDSTNLSKTLVKLQVATTAPENLRFSFAVAGNALYPRRVGVYINNNVVDTSIVMDYFDYTRRTYNLPLNYIGSTTDTVTFDNIATSGFDRMVISNFELTYPRLFNFTGFQNFEFELAANLAGNYLEISGFSAGGVAPVLYDLTNQKRYVGVISGSLMKFALEPSAVSRKLVFASQAPAQLKTVTTFIQRNFIDYGLPANQGNYLIISNSALFDDGNGNNPVEDYRAYRASPAGGSYVSKTYLIDQLVDQFAFGIKMHPSSIRNFLRFAKDQFSTAPEFVFLIGKGINYRAFRGSENSSNVTTKENLTKLSLVPTFGFPASDNLLTSPPGSSQPEIPISRLSVIYPYEITDYLEKVKEYEAALKTNSCSFSEEAWKKNVIHVVGGSDESLGTILDNYMAKYSGIISDTMYGAKVTSFSKTSSDAVVQASSTALTALIDNGVGLITYFGHSSSTTLGFNLDAPEDYSNQGKYPMFIALGCNAGNFYSFNTTRFYAKETLSEKFNLAPNRGTVIFIASSNFGIVHYLDLMNTKVYEALSRTKYGQPIGVIYDEAIRQLFNQVTQNDFYARFHVEQAVIHGDPALRLNYHDKPDFVVEDQMVRIDPAFISVADSKFNLDIEIVNQGKAVNGLLVVNIMRKYPDQSVDTIIRDTITAPDYSAKLHYELGVNALRGIGSESITVSIDDPGVFDEYCESNNRVTKNFTIYEDEARPIYPFDYAIVNQQGIKLYASTANSFASSKDYVMQIDTTAQFNSALKHEQRITSSGGLLEFQAGINFTDSTVYYWRVAPVPSSGDYVWVRSSFIYLPAYDQGFNQSHFEQQTESTMDKLRFDSTSRKLEFKKVAHNIFIKNGVYPTYSNQDVAFIISLDDDPLIRSGCNYNEIIFNVFDPITLQPWLNDYSGPTGLYNSFKATCGSGRQYNFQYLLSTSAQRKSAMDFLDMVPNGYIISVRSNASQNQNGNTYAAEWKADTLLFGSGNSLYHRLYNAGFATLDSFYFPRAFAFVYKKAGSGSSLVNYSMTNGIFDGITMSTDISTPGYSGTMTSPLFGPAKRWKELKWQGFSLDNPPTDKASLDVIGLDRTGNETLLIPNMSTILTDVDITSIDPEVYPFLKLRLHNEDTTNLTPYQLKYWRLIYDPVPEGSLAANQFLNLKDTIELGEPLNFDVAFKNISISDFDSLKLSFTLTDAANRTQQLPFVKSKPLVAGDTIHVSYQFDTEKIPGDNTIILWINPEYDQPEQHLFNNFGYKRFYVRPDSLDPLLDVTFDGVHILNKDIVSSKPRILIELKDEAKWMLLNDTSLVSLSVKYPDGSVRPFNFANIDTVKFNPTTTAPATDNKASIDFTPYFDQDGEYELIVTGHDRSNNKAGKIDYRVSFQVINKPMISNILNYPNPFTTSTAFVFTITGSEVPQNIKIEILTVTGKIVREITKEELGPLHVGRNITEFKWDGTDQYGQRLANGVYLYRVVTNLNGRPLDKYKAQNDNTDKYFNKGYGKMYLMR